MAPILPLAAVDSSSGRLVRHPTASTTQADGPFGARNWPSSNP